MVAWISEFSNLEIQSKNFQSDKEREARNNPTWSFCNFFILQEEIAILYESLGLHSDALIQYDELDALLTQYLENSRTYPGIVMLTITYSDPNFNKSTKNQHFFINKNNKNFNILVILISKIQYFLTNSFWFQGPGLGEYWIWVRACDSRSSDHNR